MCIINFVSL